MKSSDVRDSDIAVIGMACRFPGAPDVETFWRNLREGRESTTFFSDDELLDAGVDPHLLRDPSYVKAGQILPGIELFDAERFGIAADEAELLDPQQRHFLECAAAALESAGYGTEAYPGPVGVYAGAGLNGYQLHNLRERWRKATSVDAYRLMLANDKDFLATRVSYKLDLRGPSVNVNTACSTSLVAVHYACLALLAGECDLALAGSVHLRIPQIAGYAHQEGMIFSPDGRCRAFDERAGGTIIGSGAAAVVLRRLGDALAAGDAVRAVIRGTAVNNDGAGKIGYTAPSVDGQAAVIAAAQDVATVRADTVTYVEAHGTGTPLGDPIEVAALKQAFTRHTTRRGFCGLGSVKTNIGHLDAAAGMAGLIKTVLMLERGELVPSLHFERPNPAIELDESPFRVITKHEPWPAGDTPRRAGVSSFGIGGTNAHAVLEEPPAQPKTQSDEPFLLVLSARSAASLQVLTNDLARHLREHGELDSAAVAWTLATGRRAWPHRLALVSHDLRAAALSLAIGDASVLQGHVIADEPLTGAWPEPASMPRAEFLSRVAERWVAGAKIDWGAVFSPAARRRVPLPITPFERGRYWIEESAHHSAAAPRLRQRMDAAEGKERASIAMEFIQREIARMLGSGDDLPDPDRNLLELGLESLMLIDITSRLAVELERPLPSSSFIQYPTIRAFVCSLSGNGGDGPNRTSRRAALAGGEAR